jgi:hypothetical protein
MMGEFTMNGGTITKNGAPPLTGVEFETPTYGGGVCTNASDCTFTMSGGLITGNKAGEGSGVYSGGTFNMSGSAVVAADNDVYLPTGRTITLTGNLTGTAPVATITVPAAGYTTLPPGTQVLDGDLAGNYTEFAVTSPGDGSAWVVDSDGKLQQIF